MQNRITDIPQINFTDSAFSVFYDVVDDPYFMDRDADMIYLALRKKLRAVPFCDYLKRYLYKNAALTEPFREVDGEVYRRILAQAFRDNGAPISFTPTTVKSSTLFKNWLTQKSVRREVALLLGFGLMMTEEEVNEMLMKALHEATLDPADPEELVAWFCFRHHYPYSRYRELLELRTTLRSARNVPKAMPEEDRELLKYLLNAKQKKSAVRRDDAIKGAFDALFARAQTVAAEILAGEGGVMPESVTEADLEKILCAAIPRDGHGNLSPAKKSLLCDLFAGKSPSRQRLGRVRLGKEKPDRFDLITLSFFVASQKTGDRKQRYSDFLVETNGLLEQCGFGPLYVANPYECFVLMCVLSEDPLATYCDVWELSYSGTDG